MTTLERVAIVVLAWGFLISCFTTYLFYRASRATRLPPRCPHCFPPRRWTADGWYRRCDGCGEEQYDDDYEGNRWP